MAAARVLRHCHRLGVDSIVTSIHRASHMLSLQPYRSSTPRSPFACAMRGGLLRMLVVLMLAHRYVCETNVATVS